MTDDKRKIHYILTGRGGGGSGTQVQADWNQTDTEQPDYIKNKPELATVATTGDYDDLSNKPTIPAAPVQSDWNEADTGSLAYIANKPAILTQWFGTQAEYDAIVTKDPNVIYNIEGSDNVQADWNQSDSSAEDYIKNKPTIPTVPAMTTETLTFTLQGGTVKTLNFYVEPNYFYVQDVSGSSNTLSIVKNDGSAPTIEVFKSTDTVNWTSMGNTDTTAITATIPANGKLYLKATATKWANDYSENNKITASGNFNVGGNIMSLLNGDNFENTSFGNVDKQFANLFSGSSTLISASNLTLPNNVTEACYYNMFINCTSLTTPPTLPATTLAGQCYQGMFNGCTSLTTAPALPATTLAYRCYFYMFEYCSLTVAPVLPATTLDEGSYWGMFSECTSLNSVTTYAQDISAENCTLNWLENVAGQGDFYNLGGATYTSGASGIPTGWTEHNSL